jgi:hypothetical protein
MDAALESYEYALREELTGKTAAEILKAMGVIPTFGCEACARTNDGAAIGPAGLTVLS